MTTFRYKPLNWQRAPLIETNSDLAGLVEQVGCKGSILHLLGHTPEQYEDIYVVLVDGSVVVSFEVDHESKLPQEVQMMTVETYRRSAKGVAAKELKSALQEAHAMLGGRK